MSEVKLYGVSSGNGNDGVSHTFADYYVRTNQPWRLAEIALLSSIKQKWQAKAKEEMIVEGESEYTISAMILDPLDQEYNEDEGSYSDHNGAWFIIEVFPADENETRGKMIYDSLDEAFTEDALKLSEEKE